MTSRRSTGRRRRSHRRRVPFEVTSSTGASATRGSSRGRRGPSCSSTPSTPTRVPSLYYLHLMLPHQPWGRWPDGGRYDRLDSYVLDLAEGDRGLPFSWNEWIAAVSEQRHLLQAQYTDRLVGELMEGLRDEGLYDDSLVIVTADHGALVRDRDEHAQRGRLDDRRHRLRPPLRQAARAKTRGRSTTRTSCPSTCCRRSPTSWTSRSPGRSTAPPAGSPAVDGTRRREADLRHQRLRQVHPRRHPRVARRRPVPDRRQPVDRPAPRPRRPALGAQRPPRRRLDGRHPAGRPRSRRAATTPRSRPSTTSSTRMQTSRLPRS